MFESQADDVMTIQQFAAYRAHSRSQGYADPFVPYVGPLYGSDLRIVYCGVASRQNEHFNSDAASDEDLIREGRQFANQIVLAPSPQSAFWRFLDAVTERIYGSEEPEPTRRQRIAWTNLSKGVLAGNATAPPDSDDFLRKMDVAQIQHEIKVLDPQILLCVSGSSLVDTGKAIFSEWPKMDMRSSRSSTWIRRMPNGGLLYWTDHPARKSASWTANALDEIKALQTSLVRSS